MVKVIICITYLINPKFPHCMEIEKIVQRTMDMIRFRTTADNPDEVSRCIDYVLNEFDPRIRIIKKTYDSKQVVVASFFGDIDPDLMMVGHVDVVDAEDKQFKPFVKDGNIYGRGSKDMKSGVSAMIEIMNYYAARSVQPRISAAIVTDEESGGFNGSAKIAEFYKPNFVITPDPGEMHGIINREKGVFWIDIKAKDLASAFDVYDEIRKEYQNTHSESNWRTSVKVRQANDYDCSREFMSLRFFDHDKKLSEKAIKKIADKEGFEYSIDVRKNKEYSDVYVEVKGKPAHPSRPFKSKCAFEEAGRIYKEIKKISDAENQIVGEIKMRIDMRHPFNDIALNKEASKIKKIVEKYGCDVKFNRMGNVMVTDIEYVQDFKKIVDKVEGADIPIISSCGASDMRFFSAKGIPAITYGPRGQNHHGDNESVNIDSIARFYQVMREYIDRS